jgi:hypothetical protein
MGSTVDESNRFQIRAFRLPIIPINNNLSLSLGSHYGLVLYDAITKQVIHEIDGLAVGSDGIPKTVGYLPSDQVRVFEDPVVYGVQYTLFSPSYDQTVLFSGSYHDVLAKWGAGRYIASSINNIPFSGYSLLGTVPDAPFGSVTNSNSVFYSELQGMNLTFSVPWYVNAPGYGNNLASQSDINFARSLNAQYLSAQALQEQGAAAVAYSDGSFSGTIVARDASNNLVSTSLLTFSNGESTKKTYNSQGTLTQTQVTRAGGAASWTEDTSPQSQDIVVTASDSGGNTLQNFVQGQNGGIIDTSGLQENMAKYLNDGNHLLQGNPLSDAMIYYDAVTGEFYYLKNDNTRLVISQNVGYTNPTPSFDIETFSAVASIFGSSPNWRF